MLQVATFQGYKQVNVYKGNFDRWSQKKITRSQAHMPLFSSKSPSVTKIMNHCSDFNLIELLFFKEKGSWYHGSRRER